MSFYNHFHKILKTLIFCQIFFSLQEKRNAIISYKRAIQELPNELPNDFRFRVLGNLEISEKYKAFIER